MDPDKLTRAVEACLAHTLGAERPFSRFADFIGLLKADLNWNEVEIIEFQTDLVRVLMQ